MATVSQVESWSMPALTGLATAFSTDNDDTFRTQMDGTKKFFENVSWRGAAYDAAYNRVGEDYDQARKVGYYIDDLATAINQGASDIGSHRTVLIGKVSDAREAGLAVHDDWSVHGAGGTGSTAADVVQIHQDAINGALHPFNDAVSTAATKISEAAELVRAAGDLFGSDIDVNQAPTQGGRLGAEDGDAAAAAVKSKDPAAWARVASHLPANVLTPQQIRALGAGQDVSTLPTDVQNYYKDFFAHAGKDGTLGLSDYLSGQARSGSVVAAIQQSALADGMVAITNEHLGTGKTPDGKLTSPGSYTSLPADVRKLISGRWENATEDGNLATNVSQQMKEREQLANLLSKTDHGFVGGTTFSTEAARQAASLTHFADGDNNANKITMNAMPWDTKSKLDTAASQLLDLGTRNHDADLQLLTGKDIAEQPLPNDLSFGANGNDYKATGNYDPKDFTNTVFGHTWADHGKAASGLYDWASSETHDPGTQGDLARKTVDALPSVLTPTHDDPLTRHTALDTAADGKSVFQHMADNFNKNPELANSLSRVSAGNLDAFAYAGDVDPHDPQTGVKLGLTDAQRILFLSSQTEQGRQTLDLARQQYDGAALYQLTQNGGHNISDPPSYISRIADLDAHVDAATNNAVTYQSGNRIAQQNAQAMQSYIGTKDIADSAKKLVDAIPMSIPGGPAVSAMKGIGEDHAYNALMDSINQQPTPGRLQFDNLGEMQNTARNNFDINLDSWSNTSNQPLPADAPGNYKQIYLTEYGRLSNILFVKNGSDLEQLTSGGSQAAK